MIQVIISPFERIKHDPQPVTPNASLVLIIPVQCDDEYNNITIQARKDARSKIIKEITCESIATCISIDDIPDNEAQASDIAANSIVINTPAPLLTSTYSTDTSASGKALMSTGTLYYESVQSISLNPAPHLIRQSGCKHLRTMRHCM